MAKPITRYRAVLFDLDGVLVPTTILHKAAWQEAFDETLPDDVQPYTEADYFTYVDGKPRYDGVASVLSSRGLSLPMGEPSDLPDAHTVCGIGNRKNLKFEEVLRREGIDPYPDTEDVLRHLRAAGVLMAVVSSSRNAVEVLKTARISQYFNIVVDGNVRNREGLRGKPSPDTYEFAAKQLGTDVGDAVVVEDALSGVAAGHGGDFGLVIGVNRGAGEHELFKAGADMVVTQLVQIIEGEAMSSAISIRRVEGDPLDPSKYLIDPWKLEETSRPTASSATLFSVSNGNIGLRGAGDVTRNLGSGTFLSGFHETYAIRNTESAYGFAKVGQVIQGVPDASDFTFTVNGERLNNPVDWEQTIDFRTGVERETRTYVMEHGYRLDVEITRMVCLFNPNLAVITLAATSRDTDLKLQVDAALNDKHSVREQSSDPRKSENAEGGGIAPVGVTLSAEDQGPCECHAYRCVNSRLTMAVGIRQAVNGQTATGDSWRIDVKQGVPVNIVRYAAYHSYPLNPAGTVNGLAVVGAEDSDELARRCVDTLRDARDLGKDALADRQKRWLKDFWDVGDVEIDSDNNGRMQQIVHWELFQLAQNTAVILNGVPAKGLSGSGYSGHYFWDTEIFVLPFLTYTEPPRARQALLYRYRMLAAARKRAAAMSVAGALYPWRTIIGEEASAYFPAGSAQYHIDADIAYALAQYATVSGDENFIAGQGIDILVETARMWRDLGSYAQDGHFHIYGVTGPDEYTAIVDDNFFTNVMAKFNLQTAARTLHRLRAMDPDAAAAAESRLNIDENEADEWRRAASAMALIVDPRSGIHAQDAQFLSRPRWDFEHRTARPLLLYYHPLVIYRHQVLKQVDVVMALYLLSSWFTGEQKRADFDYYDPLTTGDSTLSSPCQAIMAATVGHGAKALRYFNQALFTDVANLHRNTADGIHLAAAGGVWSALVFGFGGLSDTGGEHITIDPRLPDQWRSLSYHLTVRGAVLNVVVSHKGVDVTRVSGDAVTITVQGKQRTI